MATYSNWQRGCVQSAVVFGSNPRVATINIQVLVSQLAEEIGLEPIE